jgi:predicted ATP-dependent serine protease
VQNGWGQWQNHLWWFPKQICSELRYTSGIFSLHVLIIDSIQTVYKPDIPSAPGSVVQVRECAAQLLRMAKNTETAVFIAGHVTKDGAIAGPRVLEHMVDTVLYFEGERHTQYRILQAVKNRFGALEIGVYEMDDGGLHDIPNASELFLSERPVGASGSVVVPYNGGYTACFAGGTGSGRLSSLSECPPNCQWH